MELLKEIKLSVKNPLSMRSGFVLFVSGFILLLIPLTVIGLLSQRTFFTNAKNNCAIPAERTFKGSTSQKTYGEHNFTFNGEGCTLTAWVDGSGNSDLSLWIYEPDGNIRVVDNNKDKSYEFIFVDETMKSGDYRLAVRILSGGSSEYTATISFR